MKKRKLTTKNIIRKIKTSYNSTIYYKTFYYICPDGYQLSAVQLNNCQDSDLIKKSLSINIRKYLTSNKLCLE